LTNTESKELKQARQLIVKCKFDEVVKLLNDFEQNKVHSLEETVICYLLKIQILLQQGEYEDAINLAERTYNESLGLGKNILTVDLLLLIAETKLWIGHMDEAFDALMQAEELINAFSKEIPNECLKRESYVSDLKGSYYATKKNPDLDRAFEYVEKGLELRKKMGNELDIGFSLLKYGFRLIKSEIESGLEYINQALELGKKYGNKYLMALAKRDLMIFYFGRGELEIAIKYGDQSLELFKQINNKVRSAALLSVIGDVYRIKGEFDRSIEYMEQALEINKEVRITSQQPLIFGNLVQVNVEKGDLDKAQQYFKQLEHLNNQVDNEWAKLNYRTSKALLLKNSSRIKNLTAAQELYKELIEEKTQFHNGILLEYCELLLIELGMTNAVEILDELQLYLNELIETAERSKSFWLLAETCLIQSKVSLITLDLTKARRFLIQGQQIAERQGYKQMAVKFAEEYEDLKDQEHLWENFKVTNASISERMKLAKISEHMGQMLRNRAKLTTQITEDDFTIHTERKICLVCRGDIKGYMYACECNANYCESCAQALTNLENVCWACNAPMDRSKPVKQYKEEEEIKDSIQGEIKDKSSKKEEKPQ